jgi:hypothetical protein
MLERVTHTSGSQGCFLDKVSVLHCALLAVHVGVGEREAEGEMESKRQMGEGDIPLVFFNSE